MTFYLQRILDDSEALQRMERSCRLMLDFYGIDFEESTGVLSRNENYKERFRNLDRYVRLTSHHSFEKTTDSFATLYKYTLT